MSDREKLIELLTIMEEVPFRNYSGIANYLISNGVTVQKWIPVSEPPKEYRDEYGELIPFLVCEKGTEYPFRGLYDGKTWGDGLISIYPTHWMPLPDPPSGGDAVNA